MGFMTERQRQAELRLMSKRLTGVVIPTQLIITSGVAGSFRIYKN
jgi:hypothetical protein